MAIVKSRATSLIPILSRDHYRTRLNYHTISPHILQLALALYLAPNRLTQYRTDDIQPGKNVHSRLDLPGVQFTSYIVQYEQELGWKSKMKAEYKPPQIDATVLISTHTLYIYNLL